MVQSRCRAPASDRAMQLDVEDLLWECLSAKNGTHEYGGYTPATLDGKQAVAGLTHDETLRIARQALDERFARWHGEDAPLRRYGW